MVGTGDLNWDYADDSVWLAHRSVRGRAGSGVAQFARHRSLGGYRSDHRPLLARIRLYGAIN